MFSLRICRPCFVLICTASSAHERRVDLFSKKEKKKERRVDLNQP
jgi:hypothetical protein